MNEYKLTFTVAFSEKDDPAARQQAKKVAEAINKAIENPEMKLQQVYADQPPRGIRLG